jgi:diguanylate cyclase (GGDEF)-like protein
VKPGSRPALPPARWRGALLALALGAVAAAGVWLHLERHAPAGKPAAQRLLEADPDAIGTLFLGVLLATLTGVCAALFASLRAAQAGAGAPSASSALEDARFALYDRLTQLPTRELLRDRLERAIQRRQRDKNAGYALMIVDLDGFKVVNRSLGHQIGDRLLVAVAQRLRNNLRATDTAARGGYAARLGGDEFVALLEGANEPTDVERIIARLQHSLSQPYQVEGHEIVLTASIGIVTHEQNYERSEDALRDADIAMSRAKAAGKARHLFFDADRHAASVERLGLATALRRAVAEGEFEAHYQPIVRLADGRLVGFEALLRWTDPERGRISPAEFIPLAEEVGLIVPIGEWVLTTAARQLRAWRDRFPAARGLRMSVNVSPRQLADPGLVSCVQRAMAREGIGPGSLRLEITEGAVMEDPAAAGAVLERLRELGVRLSMDDFGTGHSSLSSLQRFPFDTLKIDRAFVQQLGEAGEHPSVLQTAILQAVITLAHTLGLEVIAEGVEKEAQAEVLQRLDCDHAQGYLYAPPMPAEAAESLLVHHSGVALFPRRDP